MVFFSEGQDMIYDVYFDGWMSVDAQYPPASARYFVWRNSEVFTATPCYGMHHPWWVPRLLRKEYPPIDMLGSDRWVAAIEQEKTK